MGAAAAKSPAAAAKAGPRASAAKSSQNGVAAAAAPQIHDEPEEMEHEHEGGADASHVSEELHPDDSVSQIGNTTQEGSEATDQEDPAAASHSAVESSNVEGSTHDASKHEQTLTTSPELDAHARAESHVEEPVAADQNAGPDIVDMVGLQETKVPNLSSRSAEHEDTPEIPDEE